MPDPPTPLVESWGPKAEATVRHLFVVPAVLCRPGRLSLSLPGDIDRKPVISVAPPSGIIISFRARKQKPGRNSSMAGDNSTS